MDIKADIKAAHKHCMRNRAELNESSLCGCFYCERIFSPTEITEWIDESLTGMCPYCGIDSLIASASGFELNKEFLHRMNEHWFS
jgi:hypothetical protein